MILAEMDVWHSRAAVPTRRVALGEDRLLFEPSPGMGGMLLAAIVAFYASSLSDDSRTALVQLSRQLERGERVAQPRLRYRLQKDRVGLTSTKHRLLGTPSGNIIVELDRHARGEPQLLAAMYRASAVPEPSKSGLFLLLRSAMRWRSDKEPGEVDLADMMAYLTGRESSNDYEFKASAANGPWANGQWAGAAGANGAWADGSWAGATGDHARFWALHVMGMDSYDGNTRALQRQFRQQLRQAHPDHGGAEADAGHRINALTAARKILLSSSVRDPGARDPGENNAAAKDANTRDASAKADD